MCTASASPHSPSSVARPAASSARDASSRRRVTTTRGQGRCASTLRPSWQSCRAAVPWSSIRAAWPRSGTRPPPPAAGRCRRRTPARDGHTSADRRRSPCALGPRGSPNAMALSRRNSAPKPTRIPNTSRIASQRLAREGRADQQELAHEDAERRQAGDGDDAEHQAPAEHRIGDGEAAHVGDPLRALDLRDVADREEDRRLGQRMHGHVQQPGEIGERPAHAEGKGDDAHVLDRGIGEHALDVAPAVQHERSRRSARSAPSSSSAVRARAHSGWPPAAS